MHGYTYFCSKNRLWVLGEAVLTCNHNQCFEQKKKKKKKKKKNLLTIFNFLQLKKILYIALACFRNDKISLFCRNSQNYLRIIIMSITYHQAPPAVGWDVKPQPKQAKKVPLKQFNMIFCLIADWRLLHE